MAKRKKSNKLLIILGSVVVVLIAASLIAKQAGWIGKEKPVEVEMAKAKRTEIIEKVSASGKIQPEVEVKISPDVSGEIIELKVAEGDSVTNGQLLLKIRPDNYLSAVDRAQANMNNNRANLSQTRARLSQAKVQLERSKIEYERNKKLYDQKVISDADYVTAETNFKVAQEEVTSAEQNLEAAKYLVQSAEAGLRDAQENLRKTSIFSPVNGTVSKLSVEKGERVVGTSQMAGTEMLRLANLNNMEVLVDVNENDIVRVQLGDTAIIEVDSYANMDKQFKGIVTEISNTAKTAVTQDAVTEFEVKVRILNESYADLVNKKSKLSPFRPGMTASVDIITERKENILSVPLAAVTTRNPNAPVGGPEGPGQGNEQATNSNTPAKQVSNKADETKEVVFVHNNGKVEMREVKTGISDFENIEIISGLKEGDEVISGPFLVVSKRLNSGDAVAKKEQGKNDNKDKGKPSA
ncbi:efflux RND transporter periplasmic adaptor subunit [Rhodocytophaga rosea]|uniref:Efflux RND transporter periplasmic adaptor subunit n=1 Tax=Rhodocytophaga rosea TaxID=2704465 RepID=A0A6C0GN67_9BACT|nr:efflux RND transporter periplasmic adaptor subunit [Rhodocytophaga rosea]QHT69469.1 efflux RND transporter periplasmic adaptor subunit [Rhodocytophaga rosea]